MYFHPGGKFTLRKNVGRDVTKFFNGAYRLVNGAKGDRQLTHSVSAQLIANSMTIGYLEGQANI